MSDAIKVAFLSKRSRDSEAAAPYCYTHRIWNKHTFNELPKNTDSITR
jgi:hypothetical protein